MAILNGKTHELSMAIFNSYVRLPEGKWIVQIGCFNQPCWQSWTSIAWFMTMIEAPVSKEIRATRNKIPSGKHTQNHGGSSCLMGKLTNFLWCLWSCSSSQTVSHYQVGYIPQNPMKPPFPMVFLWFSYVFFPASRTWQECQQVLTLVDLGHLPQVTEGIRSER